TNKKGTTISLSFDKQALIGNSLHTGTVYKKRYRTVHEVKCVPFIYVVGHHSWSDVQAKASSIEGCISIGPWGHLEGEPWAYNPEGRIRQITVCNGSVVDSLSFQSESSNGEVEWSEKYGGPGGSRCETVNITSPAEYLTALNITFGNFKGQDVVTSICFQTNVRQYGPFGNKKGYSLSIPLEGGAVVGFHGHAGQYLNAIGIYAKPQSTSGEEYEATQTQITDIMKLAVPRDTGPWGGSGGKHWDDGVFATVKQVDVHIEQALNVIRAVQLRCEKRDGQLVVTPSHGGPRGDLIKTIRVDGTSEFLVSVEGFYGPVEGKNGCEAIKCITFYSNKRRYGPYGGEEIGTHFSSAQSVGKIVGFFGRAGSYLNAIGVHMEYF
ncbi:agglutinin-like, partial [Rhododendron vialii]|uniref:agglutinin-like n=1 Tax=Rhododendron vialii TaxID=182163 RepID=UPI00265EC2E4